MTHKLLSKFALTLSCCTAVFGFACLRSGKSVQAADQPPKAHVLWAYVGHEHYLCSPSVVGDNVVAAGLGAFNSPSMVALKIDPAAADRVAWTKTTPILKQPVVCPPSVSGNFMFFGDGMHQTDGATLRCCKLNGDPVWMLPVPGHLVHMEGTPAITNGKVIIGGGNAGVICVDLNRLTLSGKETTADEVDKANQKIWDDWMRKYEADKAKDPDFAIPPRKEDLPTPQPVKLWQVGHGQGGQPQWHVDDEIRASGDYLLVGSAFLDDEKLGDRALFCLDSATGKRRWRVQLTYNPWAGATPARDTVLVGTSFIRFDPNDIPKAKGEVQAFKLADGSQIWKKSIPAGGVMCAVAVAGDLAVFTATDGKVRCWSVADGAEKWVHDAGTPFFAGAAIDGQTVYTADLKGAISALNLTTGALLWKIDLATDPAVKAPGMIYGTPAVRNGRVFVATSNIDAKPGEPSKTVVVCIGEK